MTYITEQHQNVRVVSHGVGLDGFDVVEFRDGNAWVEYARFYEADDYKTTKRNSAVSYLLAKYPNVFGVKCYVARVRPTAFRKDRDETHTFATRDEALAFIKTNTDFCFSEVSK